MSAPAGPVWPSLRAAAAACCPPLEVVAERPASLSVVLRDPESSAQLRLGYRSERGLFLRTYYLVVEADVAGEGPAEAGELVLRRRRLAWRRPKPREEKRWRERLASEELRASLRRLQVERLRLAWAPERGAWRLMLETLSGSLTVTFFPAIMTPNPLKREEAEALVALLGAIRSATARTPA